LSGVVPLGVFLVVHVAMNVRALGGDAAFARFVRALHRSSAIAVVEAAFVFLPLLVHGAIGSWLLATRAPLAEPSPYPPRVRALVRATAVVALAFLLMHLPELRFRTPDLRLDAAEMATVLGQDLSSTWRGVPWRGIAYLVGAGCVAFHFVAGLWGFFAAARAGRGLLPRRSSAWGAAVLGGLLWLGLAHGVVFHATGARLLGGGPREDPPLGPCPTAAPSAAPAALR